MGRRLGKREVTAAGCLRHAVIALAPAATPATFTFAAEQKAPVAEKAKADAKADAKCDDGSCCDDDAKPADAKTAKADPKSDAAKKDAAKTVAKSDKK